MRSAFGCAGLGLLLLLVAGTFDAEPLYVTGSALALLGPGRGRLDRRRRLGREIERELGAPQRARGAVAGGRDHRPLRRAAAAARLDRRAAAARSRPLPGRPAHDPRARGDALRPPRPPPPRAARAGAARPVRARPARRARRARGRDPRPAAHLPGQRHRVRGRGDARARPRRADRRRRDRDRRRAPVPRGHAGLAHPLALARPRPRADGAQADLGVRLAPDRRARPARAGLARRARRRGARDRLAAAALRPPHGLRAAAARRPPRRLHRAGPAGLAAGARAARAARRLDGPGADRRAEPPRARRSSSPPGPVDRPPRGLGRTPGGCLLVCPGELPGRRAVLEVAGCQGYVGGRTGGAAAMAAVGGSAT